MQELIQLYEIKGSPFHGEEVLSSKMACCSSPNISSSQKLFATLHAAPLSLLFRKLIFLVALIFLVCCTLHAVSNCVTFSFALCSQKELLPPLPKATYSIGYGKQQVGKRRASLREVYDIARRIGNWEKINAVLVMGILYINL